MDVQQRRALTEEVLGRYILGPAAATAATRQAMARLDDPRAVVVVEGVSDQIAVETLARRHGADLAGERAAVVPIGGAHAMARGVAAVAAKWPAARVGCMCDAAEEPIVRSGLARHGFGAADGRADFGFSVCAPDLEGELLGALGAGEAVRCIEEHGDLAALRSLQRQPAWRERPLPQQLHRFVRSSSHRNMRYAVVLTAQIPLQRMPRPLADAVALLIRRS